MDATEHHRRTADPAALDWSAEEDVVDLGDQTLITEQPGGPQWIGHAGEQDRSEGISLGDLRRHPVVAEPSAGGFHQLLEQLGARQLRQTQPRPSRHEHPTRAVGEGPSPRPGYGDPALPRIRRWIARII